MTTEQEIDRQIAGDYKRFYDSVYDGPLPDDLVDRFKNVLFYSAPAAHKCKMDLCKSIVSKKPYDLTNLEIGVIINLIFGVPFCSLYKTVEEAIDANIELERIRDAFNSTVNQMQEVLSKKKDRLMSLSGVTGAAPFKKPVIHSV